MSIGLYCGCSGWYYDGWRGDFYPHELDKKQWLGHYAEQFSTVEINATFYRFPFPNVVKGWYNKTPKHFVFTVKANRQITHRKKWQDTEDIVTRQYESCGVLKEKLGCVLFQLPPSSRYTAGFLNTILGQLDTNYRNVIEFRHPSWFVEEVYERLREAGVIFAMVSAPRKAKLPEDAVVTGDAAFVRFHGTSDWYRHYYTDDELQQWAERIRDLDPKVCYAYFNNDYNGHAITNAKRFRELLVGDGPRVLGLDPPHLNDERRK